MPPLSSAKKAKMEKVCASHQQDISSIDSDLAILKLAMATGPEAESEMVGSAGEANAAIHDLGHVVASAGVASEPAVRRFRQLLQRFGDLMTNPPDHPTAAAGDQLVAMIGSSANQIGCPLGF